MARRLEMLQPDQTNRPLQRQMAESLLTAGLDGAIEFAALNGWQGVLCELYGFAPVRRTGRTGSAPAGGIGERWEKGREHPSTGQPRPIRIGSPRTGIGKKRRKS